MMPTNTTSFSVARLLLAFALAAPSHAVDIERPEVQFVDKMGVNLANGQVTYNLTTLSIGGVMGLSHSVGAYANEFNYPGNSGFSDKFGHAVRVVQLCTHPSNCNPMTVMRVQDWNDSASFTNTEPNFAPISDERHTLQVVGNEYVWSKPDGTVVRFNTAGGGLKSVEYPNGFTIWVNAGSVNTNTGFQIKYYYTATNGSSHGKTEPANLQAPIIDPTWPLKNPQYVRGINAWKRFCPWTTESCTAGDEWPTAKFEWPSGMPRAMFIGDSIVKVTDSAKRVTTFKFRAYDLSKNEFGQVVPPYQLNTQFSPRLVELTPPGASAVRMTYDYNNLFTGNMYRLDYRLQTAGVIKTASRQGVSQAYTINQLYMGSDIQNLGGVNGGIYMVHQQNQYGNPSATYSLQSLDGRIYFEDSGRNFPERYEKNGAPTEHYFYGTRSNLTNVKYNDPAGAGYEVFAEYPASCTNRKTCNQATRVRDGNGNWTDYTYHGDSGHLERVTHPANKEGIRAEARYSYSLRYATYYNPSGVKVQSPQGIWMKTAEEYCINSTATNGNCAGSDEVVTTYEYNHPNLLMTGMVVTAPGGLVRRTCYQYDDFGNQIGVTTPNASLTSCPGVTP